MKTREFAQTALKMLGLYFIINSIPWIYEIIVGWSIYINADAYIDKFYFFQASGRFCINIIVGLGILVFSKTMSTFLFSAGSDIEIPFTAKEFQKVLFSCIGLYLTLTAVETCLNTVSIVMDRETNWLMSERIATGLKQSSGSIIKFILGIGLFIQSKGVVTIWDTLNRKEQP